MVTSMIGKLANYAGGTIPNTELEGVEDDVSEKGGKKQGQKVSLPKFTVSEGSFPSVINDTAKVTNSKGKVFKVSQSKENFAKSGVPKDTDITGGPVNGSAAKNNLPKVSVHVDLTS